MSSVSASHLVIFIASIVVAAGVAGTLVTQVDRVSTSIVNQNEDVEERIDTDIRIVSDTGSPDSIYTGTGALTLYVKNTGGTELTPDVGSIDVLIEGSFNSPDTVSRVDGQNDRWPPGTVVEVTVDSPSPAPSGPTRVTVSVRENEDSIRFTA
ncbi:fla cluster protein FlaG [Natronomonas moolapensis 8.8.11]|uniref:Fla cluster protein FlaG n=1 Tax=Natronomonas moolapensis (strain DSM 18674 / CECT 7526 / JCM 14361 / 8.8.11) TaxID=268739 RepID=M1XL99_NATM8|nr:fla cluster protein FlaG [Natronomonas moolapensis]CCQ37338.1 fla cluster protein FlaG [Natronomonas moolapensis 8.8.11]